MPAISTLRDLVKRDYVQGVGQTNHHGWAYRNPGIILVFCIVFVLFAGLLFIAVNKSLKKRRARTEAAKQRAGA